MTALLEIDRVTVRYRGLVAVNAVSFDLEPDEIVSLIGPNGAGKTTLFNAITGFVRPSGGQVRFRGQDLTGRRPHEIARLGLARTFQQRSYFPGLTVGDNLRTATRQLHHPRASRNETSGTATARAAGSAGHRGEAAQRAEELLELTGLAHRRDHVASHLPYGEQRVLGMALALALEPAALLLDEPCAGMNPAEIDRVIELLGHVRARRLAVVVVEHQMKFVMGISDRVVVLDHGEKLAEGTAEQVRSDPRVIEAYLGKGAGQDARRGNGTRQGADRARGARDAAADA